MRVDILVIDPQVLVRGVVISVFPPLVLLEEEHCVCIYSTTCVFVSPAVLKGSEGEGGSVTQHVGDSFCNWKQHFKSTHAHIV